jgi:long-chain acyl-CoA synthetase
MFFEKAARNPEQRFYTKDRHKYFRPEPFSAIYKKSQKLASYLLSQGIQPGDRVAIFSDNRAEWLVTDMGIQQAGQLPCPWVRFYRYRAAVYSGAQRD